MSAILCLTAWNDPMGTPNCRRSLAWSRFNSRIRWHAPSVEAAVPTVASCTARTTASSESEPTSSRSESTLTSSRSMVACRVVASIGSNSRATTASPGTTTTRSPPSMRTTTAISSAVAPSTTKHLIPDRTNESPSRVAEAPIWSRSQVPAPSSTARVPVAPAAATGARKRSC